MEVSLNMIPISDSAFNIAATPTVGNILEFRHCLCKKGVSYRVINAARLEFLSFMVI